MCRERAEAGVRHASGQRQGRRSRYSEELVSARLRRGSIGCRRHMINYQPQASWYCAHCGSRVSPFREPALSLLSARTAAIPSANPERERSSRENEQMLWIGCLQSSHAFLQGGMRERICSVGLLSPPMNMHLRHHHHVFASLSIEDEIDDDEDRGCKRKYALRDGLPCSS